MKSQKTLGYAMIGAAIVLAAVWLSFSAFFAVLLAIAILVLGGLALVR